MTRTFRSLGKKHTQIAPSFGSMVEGRTDILGSYVLVLVGLLQPLVLLIVYYIARTSSRSLRKLCIRLDNPLEVCMGKNIYTQEG